MRSRQRFCIILLLALSLSACSTGTANITPTPTAPYVAEGPPVTPLTSATTAPNPPTIAPTQVPTDVPTQPLTSAPTDVPTTAPTLAPTQPAATEPPADAPTLAPAQTSPPADAVQVPTPLPPQAERTPASSGAAVADSTTVLRVAAGDGKGQVGITAQDGPSTFRIAADGSIRIMDTVNKRLLFFNGATGALAQTLDVSFLKRPTDFVVSGKGDLYVLDAEGWTIDHLAINGEELHNIPLSRELKGKFSTISLTADGRIIGLDARDGYTLITADGPVAPDDQPNNMVYGAYTVRSNASFVMAYDSPNVGERQLIVNDVAVAAGQGYFDLGKVQGMARFLDINQGMQPYVAITNNGQTEVRRFEVAGKLLGTLQVDQRDCRPTLRGLYVDRPGAVYRMCVSDTGLQIDRFVMTDTSGKALPLVDQLVTSLPWSPGNLQMAPG